MEFWWHEVIPQVWKYHLAAREILSRDSPKSIVVPHPHKYPAAPILLAARGLSIPVVIYQHGGFMGTCEDTAVEFRELPYADYLLTYGEGASRYFESYPKLLERKLARSIAVGSSRCDEVLRKRKLPIAEHVLQKDKPNILYASRPVKAHPYLKGNNMPTVNFIRMQQALFRLFDEYRDFHFVYKMHIANTISGELAMHYCPECEVISNEQHLQQGRQFGELLRHVDAIILDVPSTGLLESVVTDKPLIVYADKTFGPLLDHAKTSLRKRAIVAESENDFIAEVRGLLDRRDFSPLREMDRSFEREFATHIGDGGSAERALESIAKISKSTCDSGD